MPSLATRTPHRPTASTDRAASAIRQRISPFDFDTTITRLDNAIARRGLKVFAVIDHAGNTGRTGGRIAPSRVVVFGPTGVQGRLLEAFPSSGLDLPLKVHVYRDRESVFVAQGDVRTQLEQHGVDVDSVDARHLIEVLTAVADETIERSPP